MARYRLKADVATFRAGQVVELNAQQAERLAGYVERLDAFQPGDVASMPAEGQAELLADYEAQLREATAKVKAQATRIAELEQLVADYSACQSTPVVETPVVEAPVEEVVPEVPAEPIEQPPVVTPAEPEPVEEPAPVAAEPVEPPVPSAAEKPAGDWQAKPTASLNIPGSLKGRLIAAKLTDAGMVWDGLADGRVEAISGIGEKKAAELREHLEALAVG